MGVYTPGFINAVNFTIGEEGSVLSTDPTDDGNWTGGKEGQGQLVGTRWGISAAEYPSVDINGLTREQAVAIYYRDYWCPMKGDQLPQKVALVVFDAAVNQGLGTAVKILQSGVGAAVDGVMGAETVAAVRARDPQKLIARFLTQRAYRYAQDKNFKADGVGWLNRCFEACQAAS